MTAPIRLLSIACVALLFEAATLAQSSPPKSLAEMAAQSKARKSGQPHVVLDDESIESHKAPIPDITTGTANNIDEILKAIGEFRKAHTRAETEQIVHDWYDKHDSLLAKATSENQRIGERESARQSVNGYGYQSYREAQATYESDARAAREDYQRIRENAILANKIQQSLSKIRSQLRSQGLDFEWFKLRCGNTYCSQ